MRRFKSDRWKAGIALVGTLLLLVLMVWVPVSAASAQQRASGSATLVTGTVQATPTEDATVTALKKEKLAQEVQQLKNQNEPDPFGWLRTNASILLSTLTVVIGGLIGLWRWLADRQDARKKELEDHQAERERRDEEQERWLKDQEAEREKRAEERFQAAVTGLGEEKEGARIGAAILLRTFLRPGYEQFYTQTFDLAVANLRLARTSHPPEDPTIPLPLTTLSQALIVVFKEAFPLARSQNKGGPQSLDATDIQLDTAYLEGTDLQQVWMPGASLRGANLWGAKLSRAILWRVKLRGAKLKGAELKGADLGGADLGGANLSGANLSKINLRRADLSEADLSGAKLEGAFLKGTDLRGVKGLTKEQKDACRAKGAIVDEGSTGSSFQSPVSPPLPEPGSDAQSPSASPAQGSPPTPDTDGSSATCSSQSDS